MILDIYRKNVSWAGEVQLIDAQVHGAFSSEGIVTSILGASGRPEGWKILGIGSARENFEKIDDATPEDAIFTNNPRTTVYASKKVSASMKVLCGSGGSRPKYESRIT